MSCTKADPALDTKNHDVSQNHLTYSMCQNFCLNSIFHAEGFNQEVWGCDTCGNRLDSSGCFLLLHLLGV